MCFLQQLHYAVVEFTMDGEEYITAVPRKWVNSTNNTCKWPLKKNVTRQYITKAVDPSEDWLIVQIEVKGYYASYKEALFQEKKLSAISTSSSEGELINKRKRRKNRKYNDYDDNESSDDSMPTLNTDEPSNQIVEEGEENRCSQLSQVQLTNFIEGASHEDFVLLNKNNNSTTATTVTVLSEASVNSNNDNRIIDIGHQSDDEHD